MIKRISKATSLLVAVAAVVSIVPASAADYKKIDSQEGTVYNAVAYKDGKFYIDGAVDGKDDAANYLADGKYNTLSDVDSGATIEAYGSKYIDVQDGDYFIDLNNGSVTDEAIKSNTEDDAASALRKNIKKDTDGRYVKGTGANQSEEVKNLENAQLLGNKFADVWYGVQYAADKATNNGAATLNVYTDANGNYIDADYNLGSIKVTTTGTAASGATTSKIVNVTNTNDTYDSANDIDAVSASVSNQTVIGQDSSYIYRTAKVIVKVTGTAQISKINGVAINATAFNNATTGQVSFDVIQKISKAQASDDIEGAKYAKSVTTYIVSDDAGKSASGDLLANYSISGGKVINYTVGTDSVDAQTINLSSKNGYNYTDISDKSTEDEVVVDTDVDGNIWRLDTGYIYKWDNDESWTKVYKVDGAMNKMSVYDANNIVAWNQDDEVYSVIGGQATTTTPAPVDTTPTPAVNKGWVKIDAGWTFYNATGVQAKGQWVNDGGVWYYIKADGVMATGWIQDGSTWYYLQSSGAMKTGWLNDNGTWYYLQSSGAMKTGWLNDNGTWYYLNASGAMLANTTVDGYKLGASGAWVK